MSFSYCTITQGKISFNNVEWKRKKAENLLPASIYTTFLFMLCVFYAVQLHFTVSCFCFALCYVYIVDLLGAKFLMSCDIPLNSWMFLFYKFFYGREAAQRQWSDENSKQTTNIVIVIHRTQKFFSLTCVLNEQHNNMEFIRESHWP